MKQHAWLQMSFPWRFDMSAVWIYQRVSSKHLSLNGTFLRMSMCTMNQWNSPDSKYSALVTSVLNTIGWFKNFTKKYTSRAKKFPAPANQRPKELRPHFLPYRCQANFERHVPLFNGAWFGGLRYRSMWAPDDQQPHQDFRLIWRKQDAMPICAVRKSVKAISENAFFGSVSLASENLKDFYSLPH